MTAQDELLASTRDQCRTLAVGMIVGIALLLGAGCERAAPREAARRPITLDTLGWPDVVAVADGTYVRSQRRGSPLWFVRGHEATRVRDVPGDTYDAEIVPAADGGAYLVLDGALWYLHGATATKVREVERIDATTDPRSSTRRERWLWALLQIERVRAQRAADAAVHDDATSYESPVDAYDYRR